MWDGRPRPSDLLPDYFRSILVLAKTQKNRFAQTVVPRPLRKLHLTDHLWFQPVAPFHFCRCQTFFPLACARHWKVCEWTRIAGDFLESRAHLAQERRAEAAPNLPCEDKLVALIKADDDRAEMPTFWCDVSPYNKLLRQK